MPSWIRYHIDALEADAELYRFDEKALRSRFQAQVEEATAHTPPATDLHGTELDDWYRTLFRSLEAEFRADFNGWTAWKVGLKVGRRRMVLVVATEPDRPRLNVVLAAPAKVWERALRRAGPAAREAESRGIDVRIAEIRRSLDRSS